MSRALLCLLLSLLAVRAGHAAESANRFDGDWDTILSCPNSPDGTGSLSASGLVGAAEMAVGHRPPGTQYGYHVDVQFTDNSGKGRRVEGRPCTVSFAKKHSG